MMSFLVSMLFYWFLARLILGAAIVIGLAIYVPKLIRKSKEQ